LAAIRFSEKVKEIGAGMDKIHAATSLLKPDYASVLFSFIAPTEKQIRVISDAERQSGDRMFSELEDDCAILALKGSLATVRKIRAAIAKPGAQFADIMPLGDELSGRLKDEMQVSCFFLLTEEERKYYESPRKGWEVIIERFPSSLEDIEEAAKCFALSRYAAAVFHSVQIVEHGLIDLGTFLSVTDPISGWTAIAKALKKIIDKSYNDRTQFERENFSFLEQLQGVVEALKNAWRNKISHAHGRLVVMTADFKSETAEEILSATRAFMRRLVDGLPPRKKTEIEKLTC
jgi:hypothetical protein